MLASKKKQNKIHLKFVKIKNCQSTGKNNLSYIYRINNINSLGK